MDHKTFLSEWTKVYKGNEELFYRYQRNQADLMNSFLTVYPIKEDKTVIKRDGVKYIVTRLDFDDLTVIVESKPPQEIFDSNDGNEILVLNFESFIELFNEYHYFIE